MKKTLLILGAVFVSIMLFSTVTAVPQTHSEPAMNLIDKINQKKSLTEELKSRVNSNDYFQTNGLIDWIIQLLTSILNFIQDLIQFVSNLFQIVTLINAIISAINQLIDLIVQFINAILDLFNPDVQYY